MYTYTHTGKGGGGSPMLIYPKVNMKYKISTFRANTQKRKSK